MKNFLHNFLTELRAIFGDNGVLLIMVAAVIVYSFVYPLPYAREVLREVPLAVIDQDNTAMSRQLIRMVDASDLVRVDRRAQGLEEARRLISAGNQGGALVIPAGFEADILQGRAADVAAYVDAAYFLTYRQVMTGLVKAVRTMSAGIQIRRFEAQGWTAEKAMVDRSPLNFVDRPLFNPYLGYATYIVPAVFLLLLQQTILIGVGMITATRLERALAENVEDTLRGGPGLRILSRTAACLALYEIHVLFVYGVAYPAWGLPQLAGLGNIFLFLLPYLLASIMMALALAGLFKTRETSIVMIVWGSMLAVLVSGFSWPVESMPHWVRAFAMLLPSTWGITGGLRLTQAGASFHQVQTEWFWLWGLTGFYFVLAWLSVRFLQNQPLRQAD